MRNTFFIWNAEKNCFEESMLPLNAPSAWETVGVPLWNEALSAVISFAGNDDTAGNPVLEMYSFLDGEWRKVRRLESVYSEDEYESPDRPKFLGQRREFLYVDGEGVGENLLESSYDTGTIWCRRDSVWSRYYEGNLSLYPDEWYFDRIETSIGGVFVEKYVRVQREDEAYRRVYDSFLDIKEDLELPYADQETFEALLKIYGRVEMSGEYEQGDAELYPLYLDAFYKLIEQNALVTDPESGEAVVLSELSFFERPLHPVEEGEDAYQPAWYAYYFFDMDGDGAPELTVYQHAVGFMVFDYDIRTDSYSVWYDAEACWYALAGSNKVLWTWDGRYLAFYQLDESGKEAGQTFCLSGYYNSEQADYLVMLPKFAEDSIHSGVTLPEEMKAQGMYSRADDQWYFRVTGEQYSEITQSYWAAYETGQDRMDQEAYTYEELFGTLAAEPQSGVFDAGSRIGAHIVAYRVPWEEVRADEGIVEKGNYLVLEDVDSEVRLYVPDYYGTLADVQVTESGICIRDRPAETSGLKSQEGEQSGRLREHRIPGCFLFQAEEVMPVCDSFLRYDKTAFLVGKEGTDMLPQTVWQEEIDCEGQELVVTFERISPVYHEGFWESGNGKMANYCLTVSDLNGMVLSSQRIAGYPVAYEQVHWLIDFSGDGFPDLALCTSLIDGTYYHSAETYFLIWDADTQSFVVSPLPEPMNVSRITGFVNWDSEMSAVWTDIAADEYDNEVYGLFSYQDGEWVMIRSMEQVYSETDQWSDPSGAWAETLYYRELIYEDGEPVWENLIAYEDIWDRRQGCLYPRDGWAWEEREVGGVRVGKYYFPEQQTFS